MKKALMVIYAFPPLKHPGTDRSSRFVSELHNYGWKPVVLTRKVNTESPEYTDKLPVPENADVLRTNPWEPANLPHGYGFRAAARFLSSFLMPDRERFWQLFSYRRVLQVLRSEGIDLIYTVSPPFSAHITGLRLKRKYPDLPWVADLSDYSGFNHTPAGKTAAAHGRQPLKEQYEKKLLGKIIKNADFVITNNETETEYLTTLLSDDASIHNSSIFTIGGENSQALSEVFEKACRAMAAKRLGIAKN